MSDFMIKGETLTNIANAIRAKSGGSATMTPEQMSTEIENISAGGGDIDALIEGSLTKIISSATSTKYYAFSYMSSLEVAILPNVTTSLGTYGFAYCYKLTKVVIGTNTETVVSLSSVRVFDKCYHINGTVNATHNPDGLQDCFIYVPNNLVANYRIATNWSTFASQIMPWVATVEELANIDGTTYDYACVGEGLGSVEYHYNGTTWEVFR